MKVVFCIAKAATSTYLQDGKKTPKKPREPTKKQATKKKTKPTPKEHLRYKLAHLQTKLRYDNLICASRDTHSALTAASLFSTLQ